MKLSSFPVDHSLMRVPETEKMVELRKQIEAMQESYAKLREIEQRRLWNAFLRQVRDNKEANMLRFGPFL